MSGTEFLFMNTDNIWGVDGVKNSSTGNYLNAATIQVTLVDAISDAEIAGQTWPSVMTYVASSNGNYRVTLSKDLALTENQELTLNIVFDDGPGLHREQKRPFVARVDEGS